MHGKAPPRMSSANADRILLQRGASNRAVAPQAYVASILNTACGSLRSYVLPFASTAAKSHRRHLALLALQTALTLILTQQMPLPCSAVSGHCTATVKVYSNTAFISLLGDKERVLYHGEYNLLSLPWTARVPACWC